MKIRIKELHPNPFRHELGAYSEKQIKSIIESCEMSDYGKDFQFEVREINKKYQLIFGHHRWQAFLRHYGKDHEVSIIIRDYDDDKMFVEMCRENLTKDNDAITQMAIFGATKKRLERTCNAVASSKKTHKNEVSDKDVVDTLSKNGITVSRETVRNLLSIHDNLVPELKAKVGRTDNISDEEAEDILPIRTATHISRLPVEEQKPIVKALERSTEHRVMEHEKILRRYKEASNEEREKVLSGKMDISLVGTMIGSALSKKAPKKPDIDGILKQIEKDINHATILLTDTVVRNISIASPERRSGIFFTVNRFLKRLNEIKENSNAKLIEN